MASEDTKDTVTVGEYLEQQKSLEEEAGEVLPWNFDRCTYSKGHLRQAVYACKTCKPSTGSCPGGVCYSCSIACHADHDLIELFNKRNFQCDCGTARFGGSACQLEPKPQDALNEKNLYNHNFEGRIKGAKCVLCEDWFHENCINGEKQGEKNFSLPDLDNFEEYICQTVRKNEGTKEKDNDKKSKNDQLQVETSASTNKRKLDDEQEIDLKATALLKKTKGDDVCKLERWEPVKNNIDVDLFCIQNWRDELCRCSKCTYLYKSHQIEFILQEEETYEPPHDDDAHTSLFDSGMKLLAQMDRVTAIEGAIAYAKLRDDLVEFLKPFGDSGKTVTEQDIRAFFESKWSERKTSDTNSFF
ncbi:30018_t:CDS:10 [Gigaspora margarita]|uniref:30018_t:CDS:1 n=1 Tax=Gigaspora margarita TaxID=4874 RepID=A0ABN7URW8_GIGMA|nr:30018_t:CDS:10 [Gigaspora margarita]